MKRISRILFWLWVAVVTWPLAKWWGNATDPVLSLPMSTWFWLRDFFGVSNAEQVADLASFIALSGAFIVVAMLTWLVFWLARWSPGNRDQPLSRSDLIQASSELSHALRRGVIRVATGCWMVGAAWKLQSWPGFANLFPAVPDSIGLWVAEQVDVTHAELMASDLQWLMVLVSALFLVSMLTRLAQPVLRVAGRLLLRVSQDRSS